MSLIRLPFHQTHLEADVPDARLRAVLRPSAAKPDAPDESEQIRRVLAVPQDATPPDQWEYQILARILVDHHVILVTDLWDSEAIRRLGLEPAASLDEALSSATRRHGPDAPVVVIPDGVSVIVDRP
jgi:hypothetical protein